MKSAVKRIWENHLIFFLYDNFFVCSPLNRANEYNCHKIRNSFTMNAVSTFEMLCFQFGEYDIFYNRWEILKKWYLFKVERDEIFFVWCPYLSFAYLRNGHQLALVVLIHKIYESFFLGEPLWVRNVLILVEINRLCKWKPRIAPHTYLLLDWLRFWSRC